MFQKNDSKLLVNRRPNPLPRISLISLGVVHDQDVFLGTHSKHHSQSSVHLDGGTSMQIRGAAEDVECGAMQTDVFRCAELDGGY